MLMRVLGGRTTIISFSTNEEMKAEAVNSLNFGEPTSGRAGTELTISFPNPCL